MIYDREDIVKEAIYHSDKRRPVIFQAETGAGKTALLEEIYNHYINDNKVTIEPFSRSEAKTISSPL